MKELQILSADGNTRMVPLLDRGITIGRSSTADLSFPDDNGLSRHHLTIEKQGETWALRDLNSKNGTALNGVKISSPTVLKSGDRISAGHLVIICDGGSQRSTKPLVIFDPVDDEDTQTSSSTVITNLEGVIKPDESAEDRSRVASAQVSALIRAGNELASHRPLPELFRFILDLAIQAVNADRGVLLTVEGDNLVVQANQGEGFRISSAVRDRVLKD